VYRINSDCPTKLWPALPTYSTPYCTAGQNINKVHFHFNSLYQGTCPRCVITCFSLVYPRKHSLAFLVYPRCELPCFSVGGRGPGIEPAFDDITKFPLVNEAFLFLFSPRTCAVGCKLSFSLRVTLLTYCRGPGMLCLSLALPALRSLGEGGSGVSLP